MFINDKLTAEYLESKGWKKKENSRYTWEKKSNKTTYAAYKNPDGSFDLSVDDCIDYCCFGFNIHTQSRFDRLWSAITEQD